MVGLVVEDLQGGGLQSRRRLFVPQTALMIGGEADSLLFRTDSSAAAASLGL